MGSLQTAKSCKSPPPHVTRPPPPPPPYANALVGVATPPSGRSTRTHGRGARYCVDAPTTASSKKKPSSSLKPVPKKPANASVTAQPRTSRCLPPPRIRRGRERAHRTLLRLPRHPSPRIPNLVAPPLLPLLTLQYAWSPDPEHLCVFCSWRHDVVVWVVDPKVHAVPATGRQWPDATIGRQEQTTLGWEGGAEHNRPRWGGQAASANKASVVHPTIPTHRLSHYHSIVRPHPLPHPARCVVSSPWNKIYYNIARK